MIVGFAEAAIASMGAAKKSMELKAKRREEILQKTPKSERWKVLALWEAADSTPHCTHSSMYRSKDGFSLWPF